MPVALAIAAVIYAQGVFGIARLGMEDPTASKLGAGWKELGAQMDEVRKRMGAPIILVYDYGLASWLSFYLPSHAPVEQINLRMRYVNAPEPDPALFEGPIMYTCTVPCADIPTLQKRFSKVELFDHLTRSRHGVRLQDYDVYWLSGPIGPPLDPP